MNKTCLGCGTTLQTKDESLKGFIPIEKYENSNYCKRCFRLTHYGDNKKEEEKSTNYILNKINKDNIYKIFLVDLLNINNNTIEIFNKIKRNKLLLISKLDLFDNSININHVINNIKDVYKIKTDIKTVSIYDDNSIKSIINYLNKNSINKLYIIGPTNSGKSSLINKLLSMNNNKNLLTTSNNFNTTLDFNEIVINDKLTIIDSPGFIINDYELKTKYVSTIKPKIYNMKDNETLLINDFYINFKNDTSVIIYTYDDLIINKYYKDIDFDIDINIEDSTDICINGFGFIRIKNKNKINLKGLNKELISIRKSIIN